MAKYLPPPSTNFVPSFTEEEYIKGAVVAATRLIEGQDPNIPEHLKTVIADILIHAAQELFDYRKLFSKMRDVADGKLPMSEAPCICGNCNVVDETTPPVYPSKTENPNTSN